MQYYGKTLSMYEWVELEAQERDEALQELKERLSLWDDQDDWILGIEVEGRIYNERTVPVELK